MQGASPSGTLTFLFTDIEGSTRLWEQYPDEMREALAAHDHDLREVIESGGGVVFKTTGDGMCAVFDRAERAVAVATAAQRLPVERRWPHVGRLNDRVAVHTGAATERDGDYFGPTLNRCARLMAVAHGGQVLVSQATAGLVSDSLDAGCELLDLGEHRLRDLSRPERVFQVAAPEIEVDFPPLRSLETMRTNLPIQLTSYVGRDDDVAAITSLLREHRLVTITGVGGVGKTRLALQVAAHVLPDFPDGAWLCELANATDDESMAQVVAAALGVQPHMGLTLAGSIVQYLRGKKLLLVLDNCEHLIEAAASLADEVLRVGGAVRVLVTSREGLAVGGEHVRPLRPLQVSAAADLVASDAVRLFVDRAQASSSEFALDDGNVRDVVEICRRLDGIPLAIELAAARIIAMSPGEIAGHLDERFRLLTGGRRTAVERHQTLRATVAWSYDLLDQTERLVFERLAAFAGSFDAEAAAAVVTDDALPSWDVLDALAGLVAKSLVVAAVDVRGATRYEMLETLRHFARERLEGGSDPDVWRRRHARYYEGVAERLGYELIGPDEVRAREQLAMELDNVRAAVYWALDRDDEADCELGLRAIAMLNGEAVMHASSGVGAWAERALPRLDAASPDLRAALLAAAAYQAHRRGQSDLAIRQARESTAYGPVSGIPSPGTGYFGLAMLCVTSGRVGEALEAIAEGERELLAFEADDSQLARHALQLVTVLLLGGDERGALEAAHTGLRRAQRSGNPSAIAQAHYALGSALANSEPGRALVEFDAVLANRTLLIRSAIGGPSLFQAALLRARSGERQRALHDLREAVAVTHETGQRPQLDGAFAYSVEILILAGRERDAFVVLGAIVDGVLHHLLEVPVPPERDPGRTLAGARAALSDEERHAAMARGAAMSYDELVAWLLITLDDIEVQARDPVVVIPPD